MGSFRFLRINFQLDMSSRWDCINRVGHGKQRWLQELHCLAHAWRMTRYTASNALKIVLGYEAAGQLFKKRPVKTAENPV